MEECQVGFGGWRDISVDKSTIALPVDLGPSTHIGNTSPSITPVSGSLTTSSGFYWNLACTWHTDMGVGKILMHILKLKEKKKKKRGLLCPSRGTNHKE